MDIIRMTKQAHIYIYGDIYNYQGKDAIEYGCVNLKYVADILNSNPEVDELIVHIHSRGGDVNEGFAIHDLLFNSGKKIVTIIEGLCASIATVIALAGSVRKISTNSEFMIHNAWADPYSMTGFNADDYEAMADFIREADNKILNLYTQKTGKKAEEIQTFMKAETYLTAEEALNLGFVTEIMQPLKAVAYLKSQKSSPTNKNKMSLKSILASAKKALKALEGIQAAESTLSDGTKIYYDGSIAEGTEVFTDEAMTVAAPDGDHSLEDGTTITVAGGSVTTITPADTNANNEETAALQARIDELEAENSELKTLNNEAEIVITNMSTKLTDLANVKSTAKPKTSANNSQKFRTQTAGKPDSRFNDRQSKKGGN